VAIKVLQQLFEALLGAGKRAAGVRGEDPSQRSKADSNLRRLEGDLARRLGEMLSKALKQVCRWVTVREVCQWHTAEEWATHARTVFATGQGPQVAAAGQRPSEVGASLVYWLCCVHRAKVLGIEAAALMDESKNSQGWSLAEELLGAALKDWSTKRDAERWCGAVFGVFAHRAPHVLLRLPWLEQIRGGRNAYVQRAQINLVSGKIIRGLPHPAKSTAAFTKSFAELCAELLEGTIVAADAPKDAKAADAPKDAKAADAPNALSSSQRQKFRRDVLKGLQGALRLQGKKRPPPGTRPQLPVDASTCRSLAGTLRKVTDSLPGRRGEVYQLCLQMQRSLRTDGGASDASADLERQRKKEKQKELLKLEKQKKKDKKREQKQDASANKKKRDREDEDDDDNEDDGASSDGAVQASPAESGAKRTKSGGGGASKGSGFFGDM